MKQQQSQRFIFILILAILFTLAGLFTYNRYLIVNLSQVGDEMLTEVMEQQKFNFSLKLQGEVSAIKGFAALIAQIDYNENTIVQSLKAITKDSDFEHLGFVTPDGRVLSSSNNSINIADRDYFTAALIGKTVISKPITSKIRDDKIIAIATPVKKENKIIGVLVASYSADKLNELFLSSFGSSGYAYIVTNEGEIIAKNSTIYALSDSENIFDVMRKSEFYGNDNFNNIYKNLAANISGQAKYQYSGQTRLMSYSTIDVNDWNIISIVPEEAITQNKNKIVQSTILTTIAIMLLFMFLIFYIYQAHKKHVNELAKLVFVDELTGANTMTKFKFDAANLIKNTADSAYVLLKIDIDRFKLINDLYGLETGNQVLKIIAQALEKTICSKTDLCARVTADEFVILLSLSNPDHREKYLAFETYVNEKLRELVDIKIIFRQGRYMVEKGDTNLALMLEKVNFAHRLAKKKGLLLCDYLEDIKESAIREKEIENRMEYALANKEFVVFLQPKYNLKNEKIVGAEALVRWKTDGIDIVYPDSFIPLFEQNGFITKLDLYMYENVCKIIRGWIDSGLAPVTVSVNFSRIHLRNKTLVDQLSSIADSYALPHHLLEIEITETAIFDSLDIFEEVFQKIRQAGFTLSMDDFGTGYSSLGMLKNLPIDVLKIDRGFFTEARDQERAYAVIASVMDMAKKLNIHTVAEGVETQEHIDILRDFGCETVQGYYFAKPMPVEEFEQRLNAAK